MSSHSCRATVITSPSLYPFRFILPVSNSIRDAHMDGPEQAKEGTNQRFAKPDLEVHLLLSCQ